MIDIVLRRSPISQTAAIKIGLVITLLALELALGYRGATIAIPLLVAIGGALVVSLSLWRIEYGIIALIITAGAVPFRINTGTGSPVVASLVFAGMLIAIWLARMLVNKDLRLVPSPVNVPLILFAAANVVALIWSRAFLHPLVIVWPTFPSVQLGALAVTLISLGVLFVVANGVRDERWAVFIWGIFTLIGTASLLMYSLSVLPGRLNTQGLFAMWFVALAAGQAFFNKRLALLYRLLLVALVGAWLYMNFVIYIQWISGWLPSMVALLVVASLRSWKLGVTLMVALAAYILLDWSHLYEAVVVGSQAEGDFTRLEAWRQNLEIGQEHQLFGLGPAGYAVYYMTFIPDRAMATHSGYLDILSQTGLVGMVAFLWFLAAMLGAGWRSARQRRRGFLGGTANGLFAGCIAAMVAMWLGDWVLPFAYTQGIAGFNYTVYSWIMFGLMIAVGRMRTS